jgi:peptidoglycan hydrolase-like protein with peptidoglycan-binding domain
VRRAWLAGAVMVGLIGVAGTGVYLVSAPGRSVASSPATSPGAAPASAIVERRTLSTHTRLDGTLGHGPTSELAAGVTGTLTGLPVEGSILSRGDSLYEVDGQGTAFLLYGARPAWRPLGPEASPGPDIPQLKQNLRALGYDRRKGAITPRWDAATTQGVKRWQRHLHVAPDGHLPMGSIVFRPGPIRVDTYKATIGSAVGPGTLVYTVTTGAASLVTAQLRADHRDTVKVGDAVGLELPDGTTATGHVQSIGAMAHTQDSAVASGGSSPATVTLLIAPDKATAYDGAGVGVLLTGQTHANVLTVPLTALVALRGGGYGVGAVEADGSRRYLTVHVGMAVDGFVEISGDSISEGQRVVVAE